MGSIRHLGLAALITAVLPAGSAAAESEPQPARRRVHVGADAGALFIDESLMWQAGGHVAVQLTPGDVLWLRAAVAMGKTSGDGEPYDWRRAVVGMQARSPGRRLRAVLGVEAGVESVQITEYPHGNDVQPALAAHLAGELALGPVVLSLGVTTADLGTLLPLPAIGVAAEW